MYSVVAHQTFRRRDRPNRGDGGGPGAASTSSSTPTAAATAVGAAAGQQPDCGLPTAEGDVKRPIYQRLFTFVRRQFKQEEDEDGDEFNFHIARYKPEELHKLASKTKFSRKEIQLMYRGFKQECPTGMVDEDSFKHIFSQFFPQGDANNYAHYVFNTIKQKDATKISFEDFLEILSKVSRGTVEEKLHWVFGLYDLDGDGLISKTEMIDVVTSIYQMLGRSTTPQVQDTSARDHVEKIFHLIDTNKDGVVSVEELVTWCSRDEHILRSFDTLDTVL